jgi:hypothetical protein
MMSSVDEPDVIVLLEAINQARPGLWVGRGRGPLGQLAYIDVDGTIAVATGVRFCSIAPRSGS